MTGNTFSEVSSGAEWKQSVRRPWFAQTVSVRCDHRHVVGRSGSPASSPTQGTITSSGCLEFMTKRQIFARRRRHASATLYRFDQRNSDRRQYVCRRRRRRPAHLSTALRTSESIEKLIHSRLPSALARMTRRQAETRGANDASPGVGCVAGGGGVT